MKRVAQTGNENRNRETQEECERSRRAGRGMEEVRKMQAVGGRAREVVKSGRERKKKRRRVIHTLWYIGLQKMAIWHRVGFFMKT